MFKTQSITQPDMATLASNIVINIAAGPRRVWTRPLPSHPMDVSDPPSVLDWTASYVTARKPGVAWIAARNFVLDALRQRQEQGAQSLDAFQLDVVKAWDQNLADANGERRETK